MELQIGSMTQADAEQVAAWQYNRPYAFYDMANDPEDLAELLDPESRANAYFAVRESGGSLVGFYCFNQEGPILELGLGMRPDLTGRGLGLAFLEAGLQFASERFATRSFRLAVATFNQRAIRLYTKAGFQPVRIYQNQTNGGEHEFLEMIRESTL